MDMIEWVRKWVRGLQKARQREIDVKILWPAIREECKTIEEARETFQLHMNMDWAYSDMTDVERRVYLESLPS